jgi:hypothetical protein
MRREERTGRADGLRVVAGLAMKGVTTEEEKNVHIVKREMLKREVVEREVVTASGMRLVREGTTGRVVAAEGARRELKLVPRIWAVAEAVAAEGEAAPAKAGKLLEPEFAFYRRYTEALLRRYLRMSTEAGRVPSFLGRELFRGNVTSYKVRSFEDVVIFCYDVEKCLKILNEQERELVKRIALQQYTKAEAAAKLGISVRWCGVRYAETLDKLTRELMRLGLMNPKEGCQ